jgi:hypothetical protein
MKKKLTEGWTGATFFCNKIKLPLTVLYKKQFYNGLLLQSPDPAVKLLFDTLFSEKCFSLNYSLVSPPQNFWRYD